MSARQIVAALSRREREIAGLVADGLTDREIAARLDLSLGRVRNYCSDIYEAVPACAFGNPRVRLANWYNEVRQHGIDTAVAAADAGAADHDLQLRGEVHRP